MGNFFDTLMECIFIESDFSLAKSKYIDESQSFTTSLYIAHKPQSDYFIYLNLPERLLYTVNNDIQIKLASLVKERLDSFEKLNGDEVHISSSFEKNATLIIFTILESTSNYDVVKQQAIAIEEDPYFFKKQVLVVSSEELEIISDSYNNREGLYLSFLQDLISDTDVFNEFMKSTSDVMSNKAIEYSFAAKQYEKLPFLALSVKKSDAGDLQGTIDDELSKEQREQCNAFFELDLKELDNWVAEILKEESDA